MKRFCALCLSAALLLANAPAFAKPPTPSVKRPAAAGARGAHPGKIGGPARRPARIGGPAPRVRIDAP